MYYMYQIQHLPLRIIPMTYKTLLLILVTLFTACSLNASDNKVYTGIDVLVAEDFKALNGSRAGLITNHTGLDRQGRSTITLLLNAPNVSLIRLFSPEHGIEGKMDELVGDSSHQDTGMQVVSLYGETRKPPADTLKDIDTLIFDIQDIGTRFYTYISTMGHAMQAASEAGIRFVVLDRPNVINGMDVAGPVLDSGKESFVGFHTIAVRHGMTIGEIALMFRKEFGLDLDLEIIRMRGWKRTDYFEDTGLDWVNPSPNMRSPTQALIYPGLGLLETTNLSVGRGTTTPFEHFGAPWIRAEELAAHLTDLDLPGVRFSAVHFTPDASKFAGEACQGIRIQVTDRKTFDPLAMGLSIARQIRVDYPDDWDMSRFIRLLGNESVYEAISKGSPLDEIVRIYQPGLNSFIKRRADFLIYP